MKQVVVLVGIIFNYSLCFSQSLAGKITNTKGEPISQASIRLLNTNFGDISAKDGSFNISKIAAGNYILETHAVGFSTKSTTIFIQKDELINISLAENTQQLDEVIVTAEKQEAIAQRLPLAMATFSAKQISEYRLWNMSDAMALVPNLAITNVGDGKNFTSIRGIASSSYDQPVATYVDGVNQFRLDAYIPQLADIERIEVLRGPQGTLYGRNAMGGVINIITKQPSNTPSGFAEISLGNYGQQRYSAGYRMPLITNKLFFGASFTFDKRDGYYTNVFNNAKFDNMQSFMGNYFLKFRASEKLSFTLNVKHYNRQSDGSFPLVNSKEQAFLTPFKVNYDALTTDFDKTLNASLSINYYGNKVAFTSITAYQQNGRSYKNPIDADVQLPFDYSGLDVNSIELKNDKNQNTVKFFTQDFRLNSSSKNNSLFKWTTGAFIFTQNSPTNQALVAGAAAVNFYQPDAPFKIQTNALQKSFGLALYGQATYSITPKLAIIAGLRYDYEKQELTVGSKFIKDSFEIVTRSDTTGKTNFVAISPKLALNYHFSSNDILYASYARGYRAGGLSQIDYDPSNVPLVAFKPEHSNNVEIGLKTMFFANKLRANFALFSTQVTDAQIPTLLPTSFLTATLNAGKLVAKGFEVELASTPLKGLEISYNLGYTDAKYTKLKLPVSDNNGNSSLLDFSNNHQILTPNSTSILAIQYSLPIMKTLNFVARGEWKHVGKQYFDLKNKISQDAYDLFNVRAGFSTKRFDLMFWARNLADKKYISYGYNFGAVTLGNPRLIGTTLMIRF